MNIGLSGYKGRVGQLLIREIEAADGLSFVGGIDKDDDPAAVFEKADVVIDFSVPDATRRLLWLAAKNHTPLVIGTTGLTGDDEREIECAAAETAIVYAANMSAGVNILLALAEQVAKSLGVEWDIEITETHHRYKVDAPSGTALALGKAALAGRGAGDFVTDRAGKRKEGDIGFAVMRGGDVVGDHTVNFFGEGERIALTHTASDRALFAKGALRAARWVRDRSSGLYGMRDVLGF